MMNRKHLCLLIALAACSERSTNPIGSRRTAMASDVQASLSRINAMAAQDVEALGSEALLDLIVSVAGPEERESVRARVQDAVLRGGQLKGINGSARYSRVLSRYQTLQRLSRSGRPARAILVLIPETKVLRRGTAELVRSADGQDVLLIAASSAPAQLYRAIIGSWERPPNAARRSVFPDLDGGPTPRDDEIAHFAELLGALNRGPIVEVPGLGRGRVLRIGGD